MTVQYTATIKIDDLTTDTVAVFTWATEYAAIVHEGVKLKNGTEIPARPWTIEATKQLNVTEVFAKLYAEYNDADRALRETALILGAKFSELISSPIWEYPRITKRQSGEIVGSPRNIVDTGLLRASQTLTFE